MGLEPGPRVGEITRAVYEMQLDGRVRDMKRSQADSAEDVACQPTQIMQKLGTEGGMSCSRYEAFLGTSGGKPAFPTPSLPS